MANPGSRASHIIFEARAAARWCAQETLRKIGEGGSRQRISGNAKVQKVPTLEQKNGSREDKNK
jgi:hypothetical protein